MTKSSENLSFLKSQLEKVDNNIQNIFLHDTGNNLKKLSANVSNVTSTVIVALRGTVDKRRMILFEGQIISSKNNNEGYKIKFSLKMIRQNFQFIFLFVYENF